MNSKHIDFKRLNDVMDTTIRDAEIKAFWEGLSYSKHNHEEKISIVKKRYFASYELITRIIYNK